MIAVSQADFAKMVGVSHQAVSKAIKNGRLPASGEHGQKGRSISLNAMCGDDVKAAAVSLWENTSSFFPHHQARKAQFDEARQGGGMGGAEKTQPAPSERGDGAQPAAQPISHDEVTRRRHLAVMEKAEQDSIQAKIQTRKISGELVEADTIEAAFDDAIIILFSTLESMPDRISGELAAMSGDTASIRQALSEVVMDLRREAHAQFMNRCKVASHG